MLLLNTPVHVGRVARVWCYEDEEMHLSVEFDTELPCRWADGWNEETGLRTRQIYFTDALIRLDDTSHIEEGDVVLVQFGDDVTPDPHNVGRGLKSDLPYLMARKES